MPYRPISLGELPSTWSYGQDWEMGHMVVKNAFALHAYSRFSLF